MIGRVGTRVAGVVLVGIMPFVARPASAELCAAPAPPKAESTVADVISYDAAMQVSRAARADVGVCGCVEYDEAGEMCQTEGARSQACAAAVIDSVGRFSIEALRGDAPGAVLAQAGRCLSDAVKQLESGEEVENWSWLSADREGWAQKRTIVHSLAGRVQQELGRRGMAITEAEISTIAGNYFKLFALGSSRTSPDFQAKVPEQDGRAASFRSEWPGSVSPGFACPPFGSAAYDNLNPAEYVDCLQQHLADLRRKVGDNGKLSEDVAALISEAERQTTCHKNDSSCCLVDFSSGEAVKTVADYVFGSGYGKPGSINKTFRQHMSDFCVAAIEAGVLPTPNLKPVALPPVALVRIVRGDGGGDRRLTPEDRRMALGKLASDLAPGLDGGSADAYARAAARAARARDAATCSYYAELMDFRSEYERLKARGPAFLARFQEVVATLEPTPGREDPLAHYLALVAEMEAFDDLAPRFAPCRESQQE